MGVSGCGKSSVAAALAEALAMPFREGDALHPPENIARMSAGIALGDADRWGWLDRVADALNAAREPAVITCSALKRSYRDHLRDRTHEEIAFVHLRAGRALIDARLAARKGHFMPRSLLDSQFETLEPPGKDERHVAIDIDAPLDEIVATAVEKLRSGQGSDFFPR